MTRINNHNSNDFSCGYIGSFQKGKGIELVLKIAEKMPTIKFHVVGGTKEEVEALKKKYTGNNIVWYGFLSQCEAMKVLNEKIDIALLPNQRRMIVGNGADIGRWTSPMKLFEYMSYGKVIISSRLPVLEEIVKDGNNALLAEPEDAGEWISTINKVCSNKELAFKLMKNALNDFNSNYTWDKRVVRILEEEV
ncbi:glycosyltransferase [uncultured Ruminococcus sp.]|uniref:glycosyltransferase n=1 Tax=uncultured Ruminococcus sp. TaxID=165186 RepID=UPI00265DC40C|nr:glycosyltransferase [uncultured Ruminococcus sp.]